jgi:hypothetical protein
MKNKLHAKFRDENNSLTKNLLKRKGENNLTNSKYTKGFLEVIV